MKQTILVCAKCGEDWEREDGLGHCLSCGKVSYPVVADMLDFKDRDAVMAEEEHRGIVRWQPTMYQKMLASGRAVLGELTMTRQLMVLS